MLEFIYGFFVANEKMWMVYLFFLTAGFLDTYVRRRVCEYNAAKGEQETCVSPVLTSINDLR